MIHYRIRDAIRQDYCGFFALLISFTILWQRQCRQACRALPDLRASIAPNDTRLLVLV